MNISKVLIISKRSALERVMKYSGIPRDDELLEYLRKTSEEHTATLGRIRKALARRAIEVDFIKRPRLDSFAPPLTEYDLVVTVGGDGTLLNASHHVEDTPLLGVLSSAGSLGVLCGANMDDFDDVLDGIISGSARPIELQRLRVTIDGEVMSPPALNDVLFTHKLPASTSRYVLTVRGKTEPQKSSGIWIATAAGSTAGLLAAGGTVLPIRSGKFAFAVREPFFGKKGRHIKKGVLKSDEKLTIYSTTIRGAIYIDGQPPALPVTYGQTVEVGIDPKAARIFGYNKSRRRMIVEANS